MKTYSQDEPLKRVHSVHSSLVALSRNQSQFDALAAPVRRADLFKTFSDSPTSEAINTKGIFAAHDMRVLLAGYEALFPGDALELPLLVVLGETIILPVHGVRIDAVCGLVIEA